MTAALAAIACTIYGINSNVNMLAAFAQAVLCERVSVAASLLSTFTAAYSGKFMNVSDGAHYVLYTTYFL